MDAETWLLHPDAPEPRGLDDYFWDDERLSRRKRYLFLAAVGRRAASLMVEPACVRIGDVCEEYAEGAIDTDEFEARCDEAEVARGHPRVEVHTAQSFGKFLVDEGKLNECVESVECAFGYAAAVAAGDLGPETHINCWQGLERYESFRAGCRAANLEFAEFCRDVFGPNPWHPPACSDGWRTADVVGLARAIDAGRRYHDLPILADALQDAGCADEQFLEHCRAPGPHVRGCWVVDLLLGKG